MGATAVSLFCGAGGCSLGFKEAGYEVLYANDKDKAAIETYRKNFPDALCSHEDIGELNFHEILKSIGLRAGELDILIGGPPCQGFSTAGARFWDDPRNHLLKSYISALEVMNPKWFIMENVEGLLTSNKGKYVYEAAKALIGLGYKIRIEKIYSQEYGVPQRRKRVLIIGNRLGCDFVMPQPFEKVTGKIYRHSSATVSRALNRLPSACNDKNMVLKPIGSDLEDKLDQWLRTGVSGISDHYFSKIEGVQLQRIQALRPGQTMKDLPEELQHESFRKRANRRVADGTPTEKRGGAPSGLKRLYADEPSLTITGAATRELIHPTEDRPLTIREAARLQTFPDSFHFCGNSSQKIQQIGNAIPPLLAKVFAEHIDQKYGFDGRASTDGALLGYELTKASAMSPALKRTNELLASLMSENLQLEL